MFSAELWGNARLANIAVREARQVENDAGPAGKYWHSYENEMTGAGLNAGSINGDLIQLQNRFPIDDHGLHGH